MTDTEIIRLILHGDKDKFRILVERYQSLVFRTCIGFLHNKDDADDLTQEIFIQIYNSLPQFKGEAAFSTWIYRITVNASLNKKRRDARNPLLQRFEAIFKSGKDDEFLIPVADTENPENILIKEEHRQWVQRALDSLPDSQRTAIILSKYDDLPQRKIAEIMNVTEGAVEALIQRAKKNLSNKLISSRKKNTKSP
jgi:RNA polymerase sigma-70 factor, ECF subfamily